MPDQTIERYPTIDRGYTERGADMGRAEWPGTPHAGSVRVFRLPLDQGGYDPGGAYWGQGEPIYCATDSLQYRRFVRAHNRAAAIAKLELAPVLLRTPAPKQDQADLPMILRYVKLEAMRDRPFYLKLWDAEKQDAAGRCASGYEFSRPDGTVLFRTETLLSHSAVDSDERIREAMVWITLRPGDTDREYFDPYTPDQLRFCEEDAEWLALYADPEEPFEWEELPTDA